MSILLPTKLGTNLLARQEDQSHMFTANIEDVALDESIILVALTLKDNPTVRKFLKCDFYHYHIHRSASFFGLSLSLKI